MGCVAPRARWSDLACKRDQYIDPALRRAHTQCGCATGAHALMSVYGRGRAISVQLVLTGNTQPLIGRPCARPHLRGAVSVIR